MSNVENIIIEIVDQAKKASFNLLHVSSEQKTLMLQKIAKALDEHRSFIKAQNHLDIASAKENDLSKALIDRLMLDDKRIDELVSSVRNIAEMSDPIGKQITHKTLSNGINLKKIKVPLGVIGVIFESRPNVVADVCALALKSSNAVILRGGKESRNSNEAIMEIIENVFKEDNNFLHAAQLIKILDYEAVNYLCQQEGRVDLIIPRGGESLIKAVTSMAKVPVLKHYKGVCHIFVDESANLDMALSICENAKCQRPGVCNAVETILVHKKIAADFLPLLHKRFTDLEVKIIGDEKVCAILPKGITLATQADWSTEYLDLIVSIKIVDELKEAIEHINYFGSHHSDCIISEDKNNQNQFCKMVDSAVVYVNASTRFSDGTVFGLGAEIGISTDKLHARGPVGLNEITTYKWIGVGNGQIRS